VFKTSFTSEPQPSAPSETEEERRREDKALLAILLAKEGRAAPSKTGKKERKHPRELS